MSDNTPFFCALRRSIFLSPYLKGCKVLLGTGVIMATSGGEPRKSAFGRTSLFMDLSEHTNVRCVRTLSNAMQRAQGAVYHNLAEASTIPRRTPICCWHCCEPIQGDEFCIPKTFDPSESFYYVYGHFDSLSCCKAYILEHSRFDKGYQMNVFTQMVREVYGIETPIVEAPPRIALQRFGGPFSIQDMKASPRVVRILEPPFVSYCMLAEEHPPPPDSSHTLRDMDVVDDEAFSEPPPAALYDEFVEKASRDEIEPKKKGRASTTATGSESSLKRFCKSSRSGVKATAQES